MDSLDTLETTRRKSGHRWADLIVGGSAILIAVVSLVVALRQSQIMEKQLAASVWPYLQYGTSNGDEEGHRLIRLDVRNAGVGPARVHGVTLLYDGKPISDGRALLDACCADLRAQGKASVTTSALQGQVLTAGETSHFFVLRNESQNAPYWERLNVERSKLVLRACYCSVLDECWVLDSSRVEPSSVDRCPASQADDYRG